MTIESWKLAYRKERRERWRGSG